MRPKTAAGYAKIARESVERNSIREEFRDFLKVRGLERNEQNAHMFAFGKTYNSNDRVKLVQILMSGIWLG
ncbi:hypothetical protein [Citrobacter europaeus]|uniref:hypothetical protein n=1 Tax=Citrobacter europaeus TaxID=1914243 RepID=UPI000B34FED1|nr:hypothetical protein [Citrobacter europaeus]UBI17884.1 hypothetical protein LA337_09430 [Citrobacter europaeus]